MQVYVFGVTGVASLYEFLGDDAQACPLKLLGQPACAIGLSGIGINAADVENVVANSLLLFMKNVRLSGLLYK